MMQEVVKAVVDLVKDMLNEVHTAMPAEIIDFNERDCTATVLPKAKMVLTNGKTVDYPPISDVPVMFQQVSGGQASIVFPIKEGDGCLLIISEQTLDAWRNEGTVYSEMKYSLSNAIAIPGLWNRVPTDLSDAVTKDCVIIRNGNAKFEIHKDRIKMTGNVEIEGNVRVSGTMTDEKT